MDTNLIGSLVLRGLESRTIGSRSETAVEYLVPYFSWRPIGRPEEARRISSSIFTLSLAFVANSRFQTLQKVNSV